MMRLNLVLLLAVISSALYLVSVQYDSRRLFAELDKLRSEARRLDVEHESLDAQRRAQATPARVERLAIDKLKMHQANPGITLYVSYLDAAPAEQSQAATAAPVSQGAVQ